MALATDRQGPVRKQAFYHIRLGRRISGFVWIVWIASLSLAMTTSSIPIFTDDRRLSVSGSGARFLPRFSTFQGLAARKTSARFRRG
jgi:hypothetical protein